MQRTSSVGIGRVVVVWGSAERSRRPSVGATSANAGERERKANVLRQALQSAHPLCPGGQRKQERCSRRGRMWLGGLRPFQTSPAAGAYLDNRVVTGRHAPTVWENGGLGRS